jgi:hypothetical protein
LLLILIISSDEISGLKMNPFVALVREPTVKKVVPVSRAKREGECSDVGKMMNK